MTRRENKHAPQEAIRVTVNRADLRPHVERHLGRAGCSVRTVSSTQLDVTVPSAETREQAEAQLDAYLSAWERRNTARGGRARRADRAGGAATASA